MAHRHVHRARGGAVTFGIFLGAVSGGLLPAGATAQFVEPPPPAAYALQNVTIVQQDGSRLPGHTVVIRAGRIESIGRSPSVPADAHVLAGDSLYVYPGLVDAAGGIRFEFPRDTTSRDRIRSWDPPRSTQGFLPSRRVVDHLSATEADAAELRKKGIVALAVHPSLTDPLMPGRGAFLLLRRDARTPQRLVVDPALAPLLTLRGSRGVYPATGMAVLQWYRQLFMDAQRQAQLTQVASSDPRAVARPAFDEDMAVLHEVLRSQGRVFFAANDANEIRRVLELAQEFRLQPVIVGGAEAWRVASELRARNVPVLVNVDFPKPRRWQPESRDSARTPDIAPAAARERLQLEEQYANAAKLAAAGVTFALVSGGTGELRDGVRKAMEYGLPEAAALRAVTATPAALYGLPQLGRVEAGLPASVVVSDAPLFEKDARILYTFVDGALERGAEVRRGNGAADGDSASVDVSGAWSAEMSGLQPQRFTMRLTQEGTTVTGAIEGQLGSMPLSGRVQGVRVTLEGTLRMGGQNVPLTFTGSVGDDEMSGEVESPLGSMPWSAQRTGPGGRS